MADGKGPKRPRAVVRRQAGQAAEPDRSLPPLRPPRPPEEEARRRIAEFLRSPAPPEKAEFPGEDGVAVSNVPIAVPEHFLGREGALEAVDAALTRQMRRVAITAVHGLRGVGKTTLAAAYAERHRGEYRATWWVRAQTPDAMRADLVALGVRLGWVEPDEKEAPALRNGHERHAARGRGAAGPFTTTRPSRHHLDRQAEDAVPARSAMMVQVEMKDADGRSIFGAIEQTVERYAP